MGPKDGRNTSWSGHLVLLRYQEPFVANEYQVNDDYFPAKGDWIIRVNEAWMLEFQNMARQTSV